MLTRVSPALLLRASRDICSNWILAAEAPQVQAGLGPLSAGSCSPAQSASRSAPARHRDVSTSAAAYFAAKGAKGKHKEREKAVPATTEEDAPSQTAHVDEARKLMVAAREALAHGLAGVRTGRAAPALLEPLVVESGGERHPLKAVAAVTARGPQQLVVTPYDAEVVQDVAKAIRTSPLGLNPSVEGTEVLVNIPKPSKESVDKMVKLVHAETEAAKISVRHARARGIELAKKAFPGKDERFRAEKQVQALHDEFVRGLEAAKAAKDKELKEHL